MEENPRITQPEITNDGEGLSIREAADVLNESGLAQRLLETDQAEQRTLSTDSIGQWEKDNDHPPIARTDGPTPQAAVPVDSTPALHQGPQPGASGPPPAEPYQLPPQQPVQQPQMPSPEQALGVITARHAEAQTQLASIDSNRAQLVAEHGADEVAASEANLRYHLQMMEQSANELAKIAHYQRQAAAWQQQQHHQAWLNQTNARLKQQFPVEDFETLKQEAATIATERGLTPDEINRLGEREVTSFLSEAKQRRDLAAAAQETARIKAAARRVAKQKIKNQEPTTQWGRGGPYQAGDGSLDAAADTFRRIGIL